MRAPSPVVAALAAAALVLLATLAVDAPAPARLEPTGGPSEGAVTGNLTLAAVEGGPFVATPRGEPALIPVSVAYTEPALDPLAHGLHVARVHLFADSVDHVGATVEPDAVTVRSDGVPATVRVLAVAAPDAPAGAPVPLTVRAHAARADAAPMDARLDVPVVAAGVCELVVDGTVPVVEVRPGSGEWVLRSVVYVLNGGNVPVHVTVTPRDVAPGGRVVADAAHAWTVRPFTEAPFAFTVTLDEDTPASSWAWTARATGAAQAPHDALPPVVCEAEDRVHVGDGKRSYYAKYRTPALAVPVALAVALAAALARRRP